MEPDLEFWSAVFHGDFELGQGEGREKIEEA